LIAYTEDRRVKGLTSGTFMKLPREIKYRLDDFKNGATSISNALRMYAVPSGGRSKPAASARRMASALVMALPPEASNSCAASSSMSGFSSSGSSCRGAALVAFLAQGISSGSRARRQDCPA
jgi:hypothetical protein